MRRFFVYIPIKCYDISMNMEDSNPLEKSESVPPPVVENRKSNEAVLSAPGEMEKPVPDPTQTETAKAGRETARLARVEELRQQLGPTDSSPE